MSRKQIIQPKDAQGELDTQRLDIWLFRTRIFKTRVLASQALRKGRVRITRGSVSERVLKPHKKVRSGDILTLIHNRQLINIVVLSTPHRRGPASEAQSHYKIFEPEPA